MSSVFELEFGQRYVFGQPAVRRKFGRLKFLVSYVQGELVYWNEEYLAEIRSMPSFRGMQLFLAPGDRVHLTTNCFTWLGCVKLVHEDEEVLLADYRRVEEMQHADIVTVKPIAEEARCVVVVDPFSTGAVVAANIAKLGYKCVCVYSRNLESLDSLTSFVPAGVELSFDAVLSNPDLDDVQPLVGKLRELGWQVAAVMPGAETGVELADALADALSLRGNGVALSEARRNKYLMGEAVRAAGVRAARQALVTTADAARSFVEEFDMSVDKLVVKPAESAGSDDVFLCASPEEVYDAIARIVGKVNCLGEANTGVLVQEYLDGTEYVVDAVSRDGEHKIVAVWEYDRQPINGRNFVCHGQWLLTTADPVVQQLIEYQRSVLDALGIRNGPSHGEVKFCCGEPVLVEVGARCHGAEGAWCEIADGVLGYNQAQVAVDAYLRREAFANIPTEVSVLIKITWCIDVDSLD